MLSQMDDFLVHQTYSTLDHVVDSDPRWYERYWFLIHDRASGLSLGQGLGIYPNMNVMDGWAIVTLDGAQHNLRVSRELWHDRGDINVGPLHSEISEPLRKWHLELEENPQGFSYDLEFEAACLPYELDPPHFRRRRNAVETNMCHFDQSGLCRGKVTVGGQTFELKDDTCFAVRDRSWGVRSTVGGPQASGQYFPSAWPSPRGNFCVLHFPDFHLAYLGGEMVDGTRSFAGGIVYGFDDERSPRRVTDVEREIHFEQERFTGADIIVHSAHEDPLRLSVKRLDCVYLRGGAYAGIDGYYQGMPRGPEHMEGETWDLTDVATLRKIDGINDFVVECRLGDQVGYGVFELYYQL